MLILSPSPFPLPAQAWPGKRTLAPSPPLTGVPPPRSWPFHLWSRTDDSGMVLFPVSSLATYCSQRRSSGMRAVVSLSEGSPTLGDDNGTPYAPPSTALTTPPRVPPCLLAWFTVCCAALRRPLVLFLPSLDPRPPGTWATHPHHNPPCVSLGHPLVRYVFCSRGLGQVALHRQSP